MVHLPIFLLCYFLDTAAFASYPETIKSGFNRLKPTQKELREKAKNLSTSQKKTLYTKQLRQILPKKITDHISTGDLESLDFSITDDDLTRAKKYERLGLTLINSTKISDQILNNELIHICFFQAFTHLQTLEHQAPYSSSIDYYLSTAQLSFWAARFCPDQQSKHQQLLYANYYLKKSAETLKDLPTKTQLQKAHMCISNIVSQSLDKVPPTKLHELATDSLTEMFLKDYETNQEYYYKYLSDRLSKIRKKLSEKAVPPQLIETTIKHYTNTLVKQIKKEQPSHHEKISQLLAQDTLETFHKLVELDLIEAQLLEQIKKHSLIEQMIFIKEFYFLIDNQETMIALLPEKIKKTFQLSIFKLYFSIQSELQKT